MPVHSQVLASCSSVFCEMLRDFQGTYSPTDPIYLEGCFRDKKLYQASTHPLHGHFTLCNIAVYGSSSTLTNVADCQHVIPWRPQPRGFFHNTVPYTVPSTVIRISQPSSRGIFLPTGAAVSELCVRPAAGHRLGARG